MTPIKYQIYYQHLLQIAAGNLFIPFTNGYNFTVEIITSHPYHLTIKYHKQGKIHWAKLSRFLCFSKVFREYLSSFV